MGIDVDGALFIGNKVDLIEKEELVNQEDWAEEIGLDTISPWYDCAEEYQYVGFGIDSVLVSDMTELWISNMKEKAKRFEELTGVPAKLIGMQNVW
jgi:hypothetical protein